MDECNTSSTGLETFYKTGREQFDCICDSYYTVSKRLPGIPIWLPNFNMTGLDPEPAAALNQ